VTISSHPCPCLCELNMNMFMSVFLFKFLDMDMTWKRKRKVTRTQTVTLSLEMRKTQSKIWTKLGGISDSPKQISPGFQPPNWRGIIALETSFCGLSDPS
jgi:hypothetical protein